MFWAFIHQHLRVLNKPVHDSDFFPSSSFQRAPTSQVKTKEMQVTNQSESRGFQAVVISEGSCLCPSVGQLTFFLIRP